MADLVERSKDVGASDIESLQKENVTRIDVVSMAKKYAKFEELTNEC